MKSGVALRWDFGQLGIVSGQFNTAILSRGGRKVGERRSLAPRLSVRRQLGGTSESWAWPAHQVTPGRTGIS